MHIQNWVHWLDEGLGGRVLAGIAAGLFAILFSIVVGYKQYRGPGDEQVFRDALLAKNIAQGKGYSLPVNYPYVAAYLQERKNVSFEHEVDYPDLYRAPLYPAWLALGIWLLPETKQQQLFREPTLDGNFAGDMYLLVMNMLVFWFACVLTWWLGNRLFGKSAAWLALGGLLLSYGVWQQIMEVSGVGLLMVCLLSLIHLVISLQESWLIQVHWGKRIVWSMCIGLNLAALFLIDYSAALLLFPVAGFVLAQANGTARWMHLLSIFFVFIVSISPWCLRNYALTDSPVGLAWSDFFLRAGDPTAEPTMIKNSWDTALPAMSVRKVIGKGLDGIRITLSEKLWSGGAMVFVAFAICGLFYRYRNTSVNAVRWLMVFGVLTLLLLYPFLSSGESMRQPVYYTVPIMVVLGAGFIVILWESGGKRPVWMKYLVFSGIIVVQALPLARPILQPASAHYFRHPIYWPRIMYLLGPGVASQLGASYGMMSDVPAGLAWYSGERVWAQPEQFLDFAMIMQTQAIGALYLSPAVLDRPYFSELVGEDKQLADGGPIKSPTWGRVYAGIDKEHLPPFFPLQNTVRIMDNIILFTDNWAQRAH